MNVLINYFKKTGTRRTLLMLFGNLFIGIGVGIFKVSGLGNDPYTGMNLAVSAKIGMTFAVYQILLNLVLLVVQILFGRYLIGIGTIINALFLGYIVTFVYDSIYRVTGGPKNLIQQILVLLVGMVICSFGLSMYQQSNVGVAPYDALSLMMAKRWPKLSYFWHRIITDGISAFVCFIFGGIIGLGTLVTAFGFGPFIQFFDEHITKPILMKQTKTPVS